MRPRGSMLTNASRAQVCYDIFTPHSGSTNLSSSPRIAVNHKWGVVDKEGIGFYNVTTGSTGRLGDRVPPGHQLGLPAGLHRRGAAAGGQLAVEHAVHFPLPPARFRLLRLRVEVWAPQLMLGPGVHDDGPLKRSNPGVPSEQPLAASQRTFFSIPLAS